MILLEAKTLWFLSGDENERYRQALDPVFLSLLQTTTLALVEIDAAYNVRE